MPSTMSRMQWLAGRPPRPAGLSHRRAGQPRTAHGTTTREAPGIAMDQTTSRLPGASAVTSMTRRAKLGKIPKRYDLQPLRVFKQALTDARPAAAGMPPPGLVSVLIAL